MIRSLQHIALACLTIWAWPGAEVCAQQSGGKQQEVQADPREIAKKIDEAKHPQPKWYMELGAVGTDEAF